MEKELMAKSLQNRTCSVLRMLGWIRVQKYVQEYIINNIIYFYLYKSK